MTAKRPNSSPRRRWVLTLVSAAIAGVAIAGWRYRPGQAVGTSATSVAANAPDARFFPFQRFGFWWGSVPEDVRAYTRDTGTYSNIEPDDYVGAQQCGTCHAEQYKTWTQHPHRFMNAAATPERVLGDFSGQSRFPYLGGEGRFWRDGDRFWMSAERGPVKRTFRVRRTIGSRYFQYYIGVQSEGPEPADDERYRAEHVLPFGFWLTKRQWVPTVHIRDDRADDTDNPRYNPYEGFDFADYDRRCSQCHTTLPIGEWLLRSPYEAGKYTPYPFTMELSGYLKRRGTLPESDDPSTTPTSVVDNLLKDLVENRRPARILHFGIECEACHNGGRQHAADSEHTPPYFFPASPLIQARLPEENPHGRTHANLNWVCARCHNGGRPQFPGGLSTWNSVEYTDAVRGSCYSKLQCVDCHEPHRPTGLTWSHPADEDDARCLRCHEKYREPAARKKHTRHAAGGEGDRCMNCHMPKLHEGLDQLVRTHTIFSPTKAAPIEQNGPNACNLCHLDRPVDWTLSYLREWYGKAYDEALIARHYPDRKQPVGLGWLKHSFAATRLVAAATYGAQQRRDALPAVLGILDDEYLLNRQFGQLAVERLAGVPLDRWGYRFTLSPQERASVLLRVRESLGNRRP